MRNFQPRAEFNPGVEISALSGLPELKFQPWVELSPGLKVLHVTVYSPGLKLDKHAWKWVFIRFTIYDKLYYNIAFVNSERWLAKSRVDITLCQHGKFPATLLFKFFVLYYKRNIKHFFRIDIQLYQHSWKLEKLEIVWKHSGLRASCFHTISRFSNFHSCWYNCISTRKMFYIS